MANGCCRKMSTSIVSSLHYAKGMCGSILKEYENHF